MIKYFQILTLLIIFSSLAFSQRVLEHVTISDQAGGSKVLDFGIDSLATDGIDVIFGESDLPPFHQSVHSKPGFSFPIMDLQVH